MHLWYRIGWVLVSDSLVHNGYFDRRPVVQYRQALLADTLFREDILASADTWLLCTKIHWVRRSTVSELSVDTCQMLLVLNNEALHPGKGVSADR